MDKQGYHKIFKKNIHIILLIGLLVISCAPHPISINPFPQSKLQYMSDYYTCDNLKIELSDIEKKIDYLTTIQKRAYKKDRIVTGCSSFFGFFFTSLALLGFLALSDVEGTNKEYELGYAKGKFEALKETIQIKNCQ